MAGNTIGKLFTVTTSGESHGPGMAAIVDGCPPGMELSEEDIQQELEKRRPGTSRFTSQRKEPDQVKIMSGIFEGKTTGTPINLVVGNVDQKSKDYSAIKDKFRPGHADYSYYHKYGIRDYRGGGRSSARETVMRVAAGAIAKKYLKERLGMEIYGYLSQLGSISVELKEKDFIDTNPFFAGDPKKISFAAMLQFTNIELVRIGALGITILMLGAVFTHIRLKSNFRKYIASVLMLTISSLILYHSI